MLPVIRLACLIYLPSALTTPPGVPTAVPGVAITRQAALQVDFWGSRRCMGQILLKSALGLHTRGQEGRRHRWAEGEMGL